METPRKRILIVVSREGVFVRACDSDGRYGPNLLPSDLNLTLSQAVREMAQPENVLLVQDRIFGTGFHGVQYGSASGGCCWTYKLTPVPTSPGLPLPESLQAFHALEPFPALAKAEG